MALAALLAKCSGMTMVYPLLSLSFFLSVPLGEVNAGESFLICSKNQGHHERRGHWGILEAAKPKEKIIQTRKTAKPQKNSAKTENRIQNRQKPIQW